MRAKEYGQGIFGLLLNQVRTSHTLLGESTVLVRPNAGTMRRAYRDNSQWIVGWRVCRLFMPEM